MTADGTHSSRRVNALAKDMAAKSYLEVGVAKGETFFAVDVPYKSAVDPNFLFDFEARQSESARFYPTGSDDYFLGLKGDLPKFDIVFLDGLHVFEQTFRDFCNTLRVTHDRSVIIIDDTIPTDVYSSLPSIKEALAARRRAGGEGNAWHGDIFKMMFAIHDFFPMLSFATFMGKGNPQTVVWRETRQDFRPRFNSLETISRMTYFDLIKNLDICNRIPEPDGLAMIGSKLRGA